MEFLVILVIIVMYILFYKNWPLHLLLVILMYAFYFFLWFTILFPKEGRYAGYAFYYFNIITMPIYGIYHCIVMFFTRRPKYKLIFKINGIGLILLLINLIAFVIGSFI